MIHGRSITYLNLVCLFALVASPTSATPIINFSVYAPTQTESPVQIVKIEYKHLSFQMTLSNSSDKTVIGVAIIGSVGVPHDCRIDSNKADSPITEGLGGSVLHLMIPPHGSEVTSLNNAPFNASGIVVSAKHFGSGGILHLQVGIVEADFSDGTKWIWKPELQREEVFGDLFDPSLLDADGRACPDLARTSKALEEFKGRVVFTERLGTPQSTAGDGATAMPQVSFSCKFEGSSALCPAH